MSESKKILQILDNLLSLLAEFHRREVSPGFFEVRYDCSQLKLDTEKALALLEDIKNLSKADYEIAPIFLDELMTKTNLRRGKDGNY